MASVCAHTQVQHEIILPSTINVLTSASDGSLLIGTASGELYRYGYHGLVKVATVSDGAITAFYSSYEGGVVIGSTAGLYLWRKGRLIALGHIKPSITSIEKSGDRLLITTKEGVFHFHEAKLEEVVRRGSDGGSRYSGLVKTTDSHLLISNKHLIAADQSGDTVYHHDTTINDAALLGSDTLIADDLGLHIVTNASKRKYLLDDTALSHSIDRLILIDEDRLLISSSDNGNYLWNRASYQLSPVNHTNSTKGSRVQDAILDQWQGVWIAIDRLLYRASPGDISTPPTIMITKVIVNGVPQSYSEPLILRPNEGEVLIEYGIQHLHASDIRSEYSLDGGSTWKPATDLNTVHLTSLVVGQYELVIRTSSDDKYYSYTQPVEIKVQAEPLPPILIIMIGLALCILAYATWSLYRARDIQRVNIIERDRNIATQVAIAEEQRALQLQMNPHFIFNAMTSIKSLVERGKPRQASKMIDTYASFMRATLEHNRSEWISLEQEITFIDNYLALENMCRDGKISYSIQLGDGLDSSGISTLPMILQPFVENAIIHGFSPMPPQPTLHITVEDADPQIRVTITDNGRGYDTSSSHSPDKSSVALSVVSDRLDRYGGSYHINSTPGKGTIVEILLPSR